MSEMIRFEEADMNTLVQRGGDIFIDILENSILEVTGDEISIELDLPIVKLYGKYFFGNSTLIVFFGSTTWHIFTSATNEVSITASSCEKLHSVVR